MQYKEQELTIKTIEQEPGWEQLYAYHVILPGNFITVITSLETKEFEAILYIWNNLNQKYEIPTIEETIKLIHPKATVLTANNTNYLYHCT